MESTIDTMSFEGLTSTYTVYYKNGIPSGVDYDLIGISLINYMKMHYNSEDNIKDIREHEISLLYDLLGHPMYIEVAKCKRNIRKKLEIIPQHTFS